MKKKKTVRKKAHSVKSRTDVINIHKSNSLPVMRKYVEWFKEYARNPDNIVAGLFFKQYDVPKTAFFDMLDKYPEVRQDYMDALEMIGAHREDGAFRRKYDAGIFLQTQSMYDRSYKKMREDFLKLKAELQQATQSQQGNIHVHLPELTSNDNKR
jgi:hypothetical protein